MKQSIFRTEVSSKAIKTIKAIIKSEDLNVEISIKDNALGDTMIEAKGSSNEIRILRSVYNMVA